MGYKFQFVTLAGFHSLNQSMFKLALGYRDRGMAASGGKASTTALAGSTEAEQFHDAPPAAAGHDDGLAWATSAPPVK